MTLQDIKRYIADDELYRFYTGTEWLKLRAEVLREDKGECQECKARGIYSPANHVHHINHLRSRPDLALNKTYTSTEGKVQRNLVSVCKRCHETVCHPERMRQVEIKPPLTDEKW